MTQRALNTAVAQAVARGGRVESQNDEQAIIVYVKHSIAKYVLLTVLTLGVYWLGGWLFYRPKTEKRELIRVDSTGNTLIEKL